MGEYSPGGPDALLALRPLEKENAWRAEPTVRYFSRIELFGVRLKFSLLEGDNPLALIEPYGAANVDWGSALVRSLRQVEKQDAENQIDGQKLHALKPIRFAVAVDLKKQMHGDNHRHDLRQCELQIHRPAEKI